MKKIIKYFIGYRDDEYKIKPLCIMLLKTSTYVRSYNGETKWMNFLIKDNELLKKYNDVWHKVSNSFKKNLIVSPSTT